MLVYDSTNQPFDLVRFDSVQIFVSFSIITISLQCGDSMSLPNGIIVNPHLNCKSSHTLSFFPIDLNIFTILWNLSLGFFKSTFLNQNLTTFSNFQKWLSFFFDLFSLANRFEILNNRRSEAHSLRFHVFHIPFLISFNSLRFHNSEMRTIS